YGGNSYFASGSAPGVAHMVNAVVGTVVTSSASKVVLNKPLTLTATVTGNSPTGTINFKDGSVSIAGCSAVPLSGGVATCVTSALTLGSHSITAVYSGNGGNAANTSPAFIQTVIKKPVIVPALFLLLMSDPPAV
ncbi:MAG: Ig-like domain-containing protein, partial [Pseudomonadota bacterium]